MRKAYIAGNWKMNKLPSEAIDFAADLAFKLKDAECKVMIAPPFTALEAVSKVVSGTNIILGAQNMSSHESGAHTGEIAPDMLLDIGVSAVILGHSERRHTYGETNQFINDKVKLALKKGLEVILCVGETLEEREAGKVELVVQEQLLGGLQDVSSNDLNRVTIAYEPVWAIGTGKTATPKDANDVHAFIRSAVAETYSQDAADELIIQYGGSVKPDNVKELMNEPDIDGALVGGASLKAETFVPIVLFDK